MLTLNVTTATKVVASTREFIFVSGEVLAPGRFAWTNGMTVLDGLRCAGGYSTSGDRKNIEIRSQGGGTQVCSFDVASSTMVKNPKLKPGDTILVPRSKVADTVTAAASALGANVHLPPTNWKEKFIVVEGEVRQAGPLKWTNGIRLTTAIKLAKGLTPSADPVSIKIHHFNGGATPASYVRATNSLLQDPLLLRGDRVVVARNKPARTPLTTATNQLITSFGHHLVGDAWAIRVAGEERTLEVGAHGAFTKPDKWRAQDQWFVLVENAERLWAFDGDRDLLLFEATKNPESGPPGGAMIVKGPTKFDCRVPEAVITLLTDAARKSIQQYK